MPIIKSKSSKLKCKACCGTVWKLERFIISIIKCVNCRSEIRLTNEQYNLLKSLNEKNKEFLCFEIEKEYFENEIMGKDKE